MLRKTKNYCKYTLGADGLDNVYRTIKLSKKYDGITGSDISNALVNSALKVARNGEDSLKQEDFESSILKILNAKKANVSPKVTITEREVSEEYAMSQIKRNGENKG